MINLLSILPLIGIILLNSGYTSADLNDEVAYKMNKLGATTLSIAIQDTVDNSEKPYLFSLDNFQNGSMAVESFRIRNTGKVKTKYYLTVNILTQNDSCKLPNLKLFSNDELIFKDSIDKVGVEMKEIDAKEKNDLIILTEMVETAKLTNIKCEYEIVASTKKEAVASQTNFFDTRKSAGQMNLRDY